MTNFEPTSRCDILPSGETFDLVRPGMSSVVGRLRDGAYEAESCRKGGLRYRSDVSKKQGETK